MVRHILILTVFKPRQTWCERAREIGVMISRGAGFPEGFSTRCEMLSYLSQIRRAAYQTLKLGFSWAQLCMQMQSMHSFNHMQRRHQGNKRLLRHHQYSSASGSATVTRLEIFRAGQPVNASTGSLAYSVTPLYFPSAPCTCILSPNLPNQPCVNSEIKTLIRYSTFHSRVPVWTEIIPSAVGK